MLPVSYVHDPSPGNWSAPRRRRHWFKYGGFWGLSMARPHPDLPVDSLEWVIEGTSEAMLVRPAGAVSSATVPLLWSNLRAMREDNLNVIVDLKAILGIDAAGMHALLDASQLFIQCGQQLVLAEPSPRVRTLLEIAGLEETMLIFASVAAARASFRSPAVPLSNSRFDTAHTPTTLTTA
jgi:anti-anti-sigma factor